MKNTRKKEAHKNSSLRILNWALFNTLFLLLLGAMSQQVYGAKEIVTAIVYLKTVTFFAAFCVDWVLTFNPKADTIDLIGNGVKRACPVSFITLLLYDLTVLIILAHLNEFSLFFVYTLAMICLYNLIMGKKSCM